MQAFVWTYVFGSFWQMPMSVVVGLHAKSMFRFGRDCQMVFYDGRTVFHSHQQWMRAPTAARPRQHVVVSVSWILAFEKLLIPLKTTFLETWNESYNLFCTFLQYLSSAMGIKLVFNSYLINQINLICYLLINSYQEFTRGEALCQANLETKLHCSCPSGTQSSIKYKMWYTEVNYNIMWARVIKYKTLWESKEKAINARLRNLKVY